MERGFPFISFAIITQNEEEIIRPLLNQLRDFQDKYHNSEIVVVDGGSDDKTLEIVSEYVHAENVWQKTFRDDFADQRNFLTSKCNGEWIFHIDSDELLSRGLFNKLNQILTDAGANKLDILYVPRVNEIKEMTMDDRDRFISMGWTVDKDRHINFPDYQSRIMRKNSMLTWEGKVHETVTGYKKYYSLPPEKDLSLLHTKSRERQFKQLNMYSKMTR